MTGVCPAVSAVLLNWRRPFHLPQIVRSLRAHQFVREIIVFNNSPSPLPRFEETPDQPVMVIDSPVNLCTFGRCRAAELATHEIIYTQDDDIEVLNIPAIYERFLGHQSAITAGLAPRHYELEAHREPWLQLGWGALFRKEWLSAINPYLTKYGEDELLHRKFDRIFTALFGRHDPVLGEFLRLRDPRSGIDSDRDPHSLWLRPDHRRLTHLAIDRALALRAREAV